MTEDRPSFRCPQCGMISHHPEDVRHGYCGACHGFTGAVNVTSACPSCGDVAERVTYDIGSGPELSCASCEWCWGAEGQDLQPLDIKTIMASVAEMENEDDR